MNLNTTRMIVIGVASLWLAAGCDALLSTQDRVERAEDALKNGQFGRASIELNKVVEKEPRNAAARLLLARLTLRLGDISGVQSAIKRAVEAGADPAAVEQLEVEALLQSGKAAEASARIESRTLLAEPIRGVLLGRALLSQGKAAEALAAFDAALVAEKDNGSALAGRAEALAATGKLEDAAKVADAALAADEKNWEAGFVKGRLLLAKGDQKAAEAQLRKALGFMGRSANIRQILSLRAMVTEMALGARDLKTAEKDVEELQRLAPESPPAELLTARLSLAKGDRRDATARLQKVLQAVPDLSQAHMLLGSVQVAEGNLLQAEEQFKIVVAQEPGNTEARKQLAQVRLQMGNAEGAANVITPALVANPDDAQLFQLMDAAQQRDAGSGDSLANLRKAHEQNPQSASLRLAYARALFQAKRPADALQLVSANEPVGNAGLYWSLRLASLNAARGPAAARAEAEKLVAARPRDLALISSASALLISQRELGKAREMLIKGRQADPKAANLILALVQLERSLGNAPVADKLLVDAMAQQPNNLELRLALVDSQAQRKDFDTAIATLSAADKVNDNVQLQLMLARLELTRDNLGNAQKALDRAIELSPGNADINSVAGSLLVQARQFDAALARFQKAAELAPAISSYQLGIANTQLQRNDIAAARRAAERAAELDPKSLAPVAALTGIDIRDKKVDAAVRRVEQRQKSYPDDPAARQLLAETLVAAKRPEAAAKVYAELQQKSPTAENAFKLHQTLVATGDANADEPLLGWLKTSPEDIRVRTVLAAYYSNAANWPKAAAEYQKLVAAFPNDPVALNNLAWAYHSMKDNRALATAEKAYKAANEAAPVADTYGWILVEQGDVQRGLPLLQKAVQAQPQNAEIQLHYGIALGKAGQKKEGLAVLEKAATLEKDSSKHAEVQKQIDALRGQL